MPAAFYKYPDYRTVLFDMNGDNYYQNAGIVNDPDSDDNAKVSLTFSQSGMSSVTTVPTPFPDPNVLDGSARFVNANHGSLWRQRSDSGVSISGGRRDSGTGEPRCWRLLGLVGIGCRDRVASSDRTVNADQRKL